MNSVLKLHSRNLKILRLPARNFGSYPHVPSEDKQYHMCRRNNYYHYNCNPNRITVQTCTRISTSVIHNQSTRPQNDGEPHSPLKSLGHLELKAAGRSKLRSFIELMRWHKPTGILLALTPSLWSVGLATPDTMFLPDLNTIMIFSAGAVVARGMGCTINDILDRKYDRQVERTKMRPIACGDVSTKEALAFLGVQSIFGLSILCLNNIAVIKLGFFSVLMIATYPLFKRFTYWPQTMLALTMNWGVLMGYAAVTGSLGIHDMTKVLPIYMGAFLWTLYYDTIYAHQDKTDDLFIGVKSSALYLGSNTKRFLHKMVGGMMLSLTLAGYMTEQLWPYYLSVISTGIYQEYQLRKMDLDSNDDCWRVFDKQKYIGIFILSGVIASVVMKSRAPKELKETLEQDTN